MNLKYFILGLINIAILSSCQGNTKDQANPQTTNTNSVETQKANTDYPAAFEGQTRIGALQTMTQLKVEVVAENLGRPWGIINLPDGRFLITEKSGFMNILSADGKTVSKVDGFPTVDSKAQGGLLDVALDPDFKNN